jgi:ABC-type multidrug transport system permease subunit
VTLQYRVSKYLGKTGAVTQLVGQFNYSWLNFVLESQVGIFYFYTRMQMQIFSATSVLNVYSYEARNTIYLTTRICLNVFFNFIHCALFNENEETLTDWSFQATWNVE